MSRVTHDVNVHYRYDEENSGRTVSDTVSKALATAAKLDLPNVANILEVVAVLPITSVEAERSFSRLKLLKSNLRSTMTDERFVSST